MRASHRSSEVDEGATYRTYLARVYDQRLLSLALLSLNSLVHYIDLLAD